VLSCSHDSQLVVSCSHDSQLVVSCSHDSQLVVSCSHDSESGLRDPMLVTIELCLGTGVNLGLLVPGFHVSDFIQTLWGTKVGTTKNWQPGTRKVATGNQSGNCTI
jgi:hypothetical protein